MDATELFQTISASHIWQTYLYHLYIYFNFLKDFSSFDKMLVHLEFQTCFVLPGLISAIRISTLYNNYANRVLNQNNNIYIIIYIYINFDVASTIVTERRSAETANVFKENASSVR